MSDYLAVMTAHCHVSFVKPFKFTDPSIPSLARYRPNGSDDFSIDLVEQLRRSGINSR